MMFNLFKKHPSKIKKRIGKYNRYYLVCNICGKKWDIGINMPMDAILEWWPDLERIKHGEENLTTCTLCQKMNSL